MVNRRGERAGSPQSAKLSCAAQRDSRELGDAQAAAALGDQDQLLRRAGGPRGRGRMRGAIGRDSTISLVPFQSRSMVWNAPAPATGAGRP